MRRKRKHFTGKDGMTQVDDRKIGRGTHPDQASSTRQEPLYVHYHHIYVEIQNEVQIDGQIEVQTQDRQYRVSPTPGGRRIRKLKRTEWRPWHRRTLPGELG
ncbi:hypothetical protein MRX96_004258 [Rhipicephalus microplus]